VVVKQGSSVLMTLTFFMGIFSGLGVLLSCYFPSCTSTIQSSCCCYYWACLYHILSFVLLW